MKIEQREFHLGVPDRQASKTVFFLIIPYFWKKKGTNVLVSLRTWVAPCRTAFRVTATPAHPFPLPVALSRVNATAVLVFRTSSVLRSSLVCSCPVWTPCGTKLPVGPVSARQRFGPRKTPSPGVSCTSVSRDSTLTSPMGTTSTTPDCLTAG